MICEVLHKFKKEINCLSRPIASQLLIGNITIKCGSVGSRTDWINGVNATNNHHSSILGNGEAFTNRAAIVEENSEAGSNSFSLWDAAWPFHPETDSLQLGEGFQNQNAIHSQGHVSSPNQEFNYIVHGKKAMLSQNSQTTHGKLRVIQGLKRLEGGQVHEKKPQCIIYRKLQL